MDAPGTDGRQIFAVSPPLARQGATVTLEGNFADPTMVALPGGVVAPATVLGPHRATLVVPPGTSLGAMTVSGAASGTPNPSVIFHASTYPPDLQYFEPYEQTDGARAPGVLASRYGQGTVTAGSFVYVIGGNTYVNGQGVLTSEVDRATLDADGSLGAFAPVSGVSLVVGRSEFGQVVIGKDVYVIGGNCADPNAWNTVEQATIQPDGSLSGFSMVPNVTLKTRRSEFAAAVVGNYVYVIGGTTIDPDTVERAPIQPDGSLGDFALVPDVTLPAPRQGAASLVSGNQLYLIGGGGGYAPDAQVEAAPIAPDGTIGTFAAAPGVSLVTPRYGASVAVLGDHLYVFGGSSNGFGNPSFDVERAPIQADGTLGAFVDTGKSAGTERSGVSLAFTTNYVYMIGGGTDGGGQPEILRAPIDGDHGLSTSTASPATLDAATAEQAMVSIGDAVYLIGGTDGTGPVASVQRATVTGGVLGSFATVPGVTLATARTGFATAVIGNYVYAIGGSTSSGTVATLERAAIGVDGTLGTFQPYPDAVLTTPRAYEGAVVVRAYAATELYVLGGTGSDGTPLDTLEMAPINSDGSLGAFVARPGYGLTTARSRFALVQIARGHNYDFVFAIGGVGANGVLGDIEGGVLQADGTLGGFFPVAGATLTTPCASPGTAVIGDQLYVLGGEGAAGPLDRVESATITMGQDANIGFDAFAPVSGVTLAEPRASMTCTTIDNQLYSIGGAGAMGPLTTVEAATLQ